MTPDYAAISEGRFDDSLIEPPDCCRLGAPQLPHGIPMEEKTFLSFGYFVVNVWGPREFKVKENPKIPDCVGIFDGGVVKGEGGE